METKQRSQMARVREMGTRQGDASYNPVADTHHDIFVTKYNGQQLDMGLWAYWLATGKEAWAGASDFTANLTD